MKQRKVIIATDGSDTAIEAATRAVDLLHPDARIELVTVIEARPDPMDDAGGIEGPVLSEDEADHEWTRAQREGRAALDRTASALHRPDVETELVATRATTERALCAIVDDEQPDLLVLGSDQPSWFERVLHGSIEDRVLHHVACPLLIVGHHRPEG